MSNNVTEDAIRYVRCTVNTYKKHVFKSNLMQFTEQELKTLQIWEEILRLVELV